MLDQIVAQARDEAPDECCGMIASVDGTAVAIHPAENTAHSPLRYEMDGMEQYRIQTAIEDAATTSAPSTTRTRARPRSRRRPTSTSRSIPMRCT